MATFYLLKTITFPTVTIDNAGNTIHVIMKTYDTENNPEAVNAVDKNMAIIDYGKLTYEYDIDDPFIVPSGMDFKVFDPDEYLTDFLFGTPLTLPAEKRYIIEVYLYYNDDIIYGGDSLEDAIEYNEGTKILSLKTANAINKLNEKKLYDVSNSPLDPLGLDPTYWVNFQELLVSIYKLINPATGADTVEVDITHGWRWKDTATAPFTQRELGGLDIYVSSWFNSYSSWQTAETVGDFLRQLCLEFNAYTGMSTWGNAFFAQVLNFDATPTVTFTDDDIININRSFGYSKRKYVSIQSRDAETGAAGDVDTFGDIELAGIEGQTIERDVTAYTQSSGTITTDWLLRFTSTPAEVQRACVGIRDIWGNSLQDEQCGVLADKLYRTRALAAMTRRDRFVVFGIDYTFPLIFTYDSVDYQSTKMVKDFTNHLTTIEAFQMPDLS